MESDQAKLVKSKGSQFRKILRHQSFALLILVLTWWLIFELNPKKHHHELS